MFIKEQQQNIFAYVNLDVLPGKFGKGIAGEQAEMLPMNLKCW